MKKLRILRRVLWLGVAVAGAVSLTIYAARHGAPAGTAPPAPKIRDYGPVPEFSVDGMQTADFKGHKVLLTFFASWCAPCKLEHPVLMRLKDEMPAGAVLWGLDMMDNPPALAAFYKTEGGDPFSRVGADPSGTAGIAWGVDGIPVTFIIGTDGHLIYRHFGPVDQDEAEKVILPLLRMP